MNFEQVQRTMEFILEHQAQATIQMQQLRGEMEQLTGSMQQLTGKMDRLTGNMDQLTGNVDQLTGNVDQLTGNVDQLTGNMDQLTGNMDQLTGNMDQLTGNVDQLTGKTRDVQAVILLLSDLAQIQSRRLDRQGEEFQAFLKHYDEGQRVALASLDEIVRRLSERG